ncbi:hypothetical protein C0989_008269, partial [Termitomyces sp. Mn162]
QGWDKDWVWSQLGKVRKTWVSGEVSMEQSAGQVGPPWGGRREGASLAADCGKQRASPPSGVGPSKRPQEYEPMAGRPGFHVHSPTLDMALGRASSSPEPPPSITEVFLCKRVEDQDAAQAEKEVLEQAWNTLVWVAPEQVPEVWGLREHLTQWEVQPIEEAEEWEMVLEGGLLQVELEVARQREDWLANEAASGHVGILLDRVGARLGVGALGSLGQCLHSICVDPRRVGTDAHGSASGVAAGDGEGGEVAGGASMA